MSEGISESFSEVSRFRNLFGRAAEAVKGNVDKVSAGEELLDEGDESITAEFRVNYELGKHTIPAGITHPEIKNENFYQMTGSVDRTNHNRHSSKEGIVVEVRGGQDVNWYQAKAEAAQLSLDLFVYVDYMDFFGDDIDASDRVHEITKAMAGMTEFTDDAWKKMIKEKGFKRADIYGAKGAYNFLLALQRATAGVPKNLLKVENFESDDPNGTPLFPLEITLKLAEKKGDRKKDRYTLLLAMKKQEEDAAAKKAAEQKAADEFVEAAKKSAEEAEKHAAAWKAEQAAKKGAEAEAEAEAEANKKVVDETLEAWKKHGKEAANHLAAWKAEQAAKQEAEPDKYKEINDRVGDYNKALENAGSKEVAPEAPSGLAESVQALRDAGFEVSEDSMPLSWGDEVYARYKNAQDKLLRVKIYVFEGSKYSYELLAQPEGNDEVVGSDATVDEMKEVLDGVKFVDGGKAKIEDLKMLPYEATFEPIEDDDYGPLAHKVTVENYEFTNPRTGIKFGPAEVAFFVDVAAAGEDNYFYKGDTADSMGTPVPEMAGAAEFMDAACRMALANKHTEGELEQ